MVYYIVILLIGHELSDVEPNWFSWTFMEWLLAVLDLLSLRRWRLRTFEDL